MKCLGGVRLAGGAGGCRGRGGAKPMTALKRTDYPTSALSKRYDLSLPHCVRINFFMTILLRDWWVEELIDGFGLLF